MSVPFGYGRTMPDDETRRHGHALLSMGAIITINFGVATTLLLAAFLLYSVVDEPRKLGGGACPPYPPSFSSSSPLFISKIC